MKNVNTFKVISLELVNHFRGNFNSPNIFSCGMKPELIKAVVRQNFLSHCCEFNFRFSGENKIYIRLTNEIRMVCVERRGRKEAKMKIELKRNPSSVIRKISVADRDLEQGYV